MLFDNRRKPAYQLLGPVAKGLFGFQVFENKLRPRVLVSHETLERDVDCASVSELDAVELTCLDSSPESSSRAAQKLNGFFLVHQNHPVCLDSSHVYSPVLGCRLALGPSPFERGPHA